MTEPLLHDDADQGSAFTEAVLDSLSGWTVVALVIAVLYLVWATLEILDRYVGGIPAVTP